MAPPNHFPTTAWSLIADAGRVAEADDDGAPRDDKQSKLALNCLITAYWRPVFYFIRRRGFESGAAEDLTQQFFLNLLERDWVARADQGRGRFRTFLLTVLTRFLADQGPRRATRQKAFDGHMVNVSALVNDQDRTFTPPDGTTPEELFMRQWALALVDDVKRELEAWCRERGRVAWYAIFEAHHFPPSVDKHPSQEELAHRFGCSRDQVRYAIEQTDRQFARLFRAAVREQVDSEEHVEMEIREIEKLLGH